MISTAESRNGIVRWYDPGTGRWLSKDPIGISGGLNQYVAFENNPVNFIDPFGLCSKEDEILGDIRIFIRAQEMAASETWWAPNVLVQSLGAFALHGGHPWSPLDTNVNDPHSLWNIDGIPMTAGQFGNYLAGYYAGYSGSTTIHVGMRAGGYFWAAVGNTASFIYNSIPFVPRKSYGESIWDEESIPYINLGRKHGRSDRESCN